MSEVEHFEYFILFACCAYVKCVKSGNGLLPGTHLASKAAAHSTREIDAVCSWVYTEHR